MYSARLALVKQLVQLQIPSMISVSNRNVNALLPSKCSCMATFHACRAVSACGLVDLSFTLR